MHPSGRNEGGGAPTLPHVATVERWLTWVGLALCGLVIATTVVLIGIRAVAGPRTLNHDRCTPEPPETSCVHDRYSGSPVGRPWLMVLGTLSVCSGAIGGTLLKHRKTLTSG